MWIWLTMTRGLSILGMNQRREPFSFSTQDPKEYLGNPFEDYFNISQQKWPFAGSMPPPTVSIRN
jgi:hypothetical protein